ncbi:hypothetical protein N7505_008187 [Penicillium chrysogenum]|uniref:Uncharacterized protein n=1 Tax=Penicillium chrysogenum TaxID=5076 RepID=A0ABQ8WCY1_PENCH|nr:hypothetical protein N7505_008187 [Penicillium chrysogenum]
MPRMPMIDIAGMSSTRKTFIVGFVFMNEEVTDAYIEVLQFSSHYFNGLDELSLFISVGLRSLESLGFRGLLRTRSLERAGLTASAGCIRVKVK